MEAHDSVFYYKTVINVGILKGQQFLLQTRFKNNHKSMIITYYRIPNLESEVMEIVDQFKEIDYILLKILNEVLIKLNIIQLYMQSL